MTSQTLLIPEIAAPAETPVARWPYTVGIVLMAAGAAGLLFAPFAGVVYVALPGVMIAAYWGFACRSPFRWGLVASCAALGAGFFTASFALAFSAISFVGNNFWAGEFGAAAVLLGIIGLPVLGILIGIPSLSGAYKLPGVRPARIEPVGGID